MQELKLFSTEFSGYCKNEVIEYINRIDREAQKKISDLEQRLEQANKKVKEIENSKSMHESELIIRNAKQQAQTIIQEAQDLAQEIVSSSRKELNENLAKTNYLYRRRESIEKELALKKKEIDFLFDNLDLPDVSQ